jgi:hypothetical protein
MVECENLITAQGWAFAEFGRDEAHVSMPYNILLSYMPICVVKAIFSLGGGKQIAP